ncbi:MAG: glutathione S-transferase family protein [Rhodospirillales bacterium]
MKIYGRVTSSNVMKVLWAADELGLDYERIDAGMTFGVVDTAEYRAMNPNGRVPTLVEGDFVLWESNVIVRYLATKFGMGTLCPSELTNRADLERWMDWQQTTQNPAFTPVFWGLVRTPPEQRDRSAIDAAVKQSIAAMRILDARMEGRKWVGGEELTMADFPVGPNIHRFFNLPFERPDLPNLKRLYDRMCERPAYTKNIASIPIS